MTSTPHGSSDGPSDGPNVTMLLAPAEVGPRLAGGTLVSRTANLMEVTTNDVVQVSPGEALVVVVHDEPAEVLLAVGLAADGSTDNLRLRVVEHRA
jgi:hypothetical protein